MGADTRDCRVWLSITAVNVNMRLFPPSVADKIAQRDADGIIVNCAESGKSRTKMIHADFKVPDDLILVSHIPDVYVEKFLRVNNSTTDTHLPGLINISVKAASVRVARRPLFIEYAGNVFINGRHWRSGVVLRGRC